MKIAYLASWDFGLDDAVLRKIERQVRTWNELGEQARLFAITPRAVMRPGLAVLTTPFLTGSRLGKPGQVSFSGAIRSALALRRALRAIREFGADAVYLRQQTFMPGLGSILRSFPTFVEINSPDMTEMWIYARMWGGKARLRAAYHGISRGIVLRRCTGIVSMTQEMLAMPEFGRFRKPSIVIPNGVPLDECPPVPRIDDPDPRPVILLAASGGHPTEKTHWHGVDKVLELAESTINSLRFLIVGAELVRREKVPGNVEIVGFVPPDELGAQYARADVAFGTLALHRKGMEEACPFKTREALAFGLPVILGYRETAFLDCGAGFDWLLQIPNRADNLRESRDRIIDFATRWNRRRLDRREIGPHIDLRVLEGKKIDFIKQLIPSSGILETK